MLCRSCVPAALCEPCCEQGWLRHRGTVACRAENWVERHRQLPPASEGMVAVLDLAEDPALRERLAAEWLRWARLRWQRWRLDPDDWLRRA